MSKRTRALPGPVAGLAAAAFTFSAAAIAQEAPAPVEKIEITGSLIKKIEAETALPVEVISREQIERLGATSTEQILQNLTSTSGVGGLVGAQGVGLQTFSQSSASLRGLGSQRTLVLVNGRRMAEFAGGAASATATSVDLNSIPSGAIERIEILQDGASSIYGSEAVAGVVNVILRKNYKGFEGSAYLGTPTRTGGGQTEKAGLIGGFGDYDSDRYNFMFSLDGEHNKSLYGRDRTFADHAWDSALYDTSATPSGNIAGTWTPGVPLANQPVVGTPGYGTPRDPYQCGLMGPHIELDPNFGFANPTGFFGGSPPGFSNLPDPAAGTCRYNPSPLVPLLPKVDRFNVLSTFNFKLNDSTKLFAELIYTHTKTETLEQPSPYNFSFFTTDTAFKSPTLNPTHVDPTLLITPSNLYYQSILVPFAAAHPGWAGNALIASGLPLSVSLRAFDGGNRDNSDAVDQYRFSLGALGSVFDWDYDVAASTAKSRFEEDTIDGYQLQLPLTRLLNGLQGSTPSTAWNPFGYPQDPAIAAAIRATNYDGLIARGAIESDGIDAKASRSVFDLPGGPLSVGVGGAARRESISLVTGAPVQLGDVSGYGNPILPFSNGRSAYAAYGELDAPIIKMLEIDVADRFDKYTGIASQTSPKASLRFQPTSQLLLRGSVGKGFRAPSLPELYTPQFVATTSIITDPVSGVRAQFPQLVGGNPHLQSEKSTQDSFGFVFEPLKDVSLAVDYFAVRISHTIGSVSPGDVLALDAAGNPIGTSLTHRTANGTLLQIDTLNQNLGDLAASGVEINAHWRSPEFFFGRVTTNLTGTYMDRFDQTLPDGTVEGSVAATVNPATGAILTAIGNDGGVIMRWRHNLEIVLEKQDWSFSLLQHFQLGYGDVLDNFGNPHNVGSYATWDAQYTLRPTKEFKFGIGVKNLFDLNPPSIGNGEFFQSGYDPTYYDPRARFVYVTLDYKFK
jgi:iron complex outermembrane receptor protein